MPNIREELTLVDNFSPQFTRFIQLAEQSAASVMDLRGSLNNIETTTARAALASLRSKCLEQADGLIMQATPLVA